MSARDDDLTAEGCTVEEAAMAAASEGEIESTPMFDRWTWEEGWRCGREYERGRAPREDEGLREALAGIATQYCREWCEKKNNYCFEPAEFVLWGKLLKPEALGPRCYDHAASHVGHHGLYPRSHFALIDLRPGLAALAASASRADGQWRCSNGHRNDANEATCYLCGDAERKPVASREVEGDEEPVYSEADMRDAELAAGQEAYRDGLRDSPSRESE